MHQNTVPIELRMLAARGMFVCGAMDTMQKYMPKVMGKVLYKWREWQLWLRV